MVFLWRWQQIGGPWKTLHISSTRINKKTQLLLTYMHYTVNSMNIGINWLLPTSGTGRPLVSHGHHGCNAMAIGRATEEPRINSAAGLRGCGCSWDILLGCSEGTS
jgi:hypothetical protein